MAKSISFQLQPDNPTRVVLGQTRVSIKWEFTLDAGETILSVYFKRQKPGDVVASTIASRSASSAFDMNRNFPDHSNYEARLNSELLILEVKKHQDYTYTLSITYQDSNGIQQRDYQVLVEVMGLCISALWFVRVGNSLVNKLVNRTRGNDCQVYKVGITLRSEGWISALSNQASIESKTMKSRLLSAISAVYSKNSGKQLYRLIVDNFRPGSVVATVVLLFGKSATDSLKPLQDEIINGTLASFTVDRYLDLNPSGTITPNISTTGTGNNDDCQFKTVRLTIVSEEWKSAYLNQASVEFRNMESRVLAAIWDTYTNNLEKQLYVVTVGTFR
ncbi:hypothetical protein OS493_038445 [Desmophyllum pertusum]|uniref:SEA domain-containing protein n=1 Tax=Desmophyllum pertusum TaxID=174260 RepID=A0A9W9ZI57_9CNID|nr:hypothetical protein OS493_038445 [Desmophyllum pertusum]